MSRDQQSRGSFCAREQSRRSFFKASVLREKRGDPLKAIASRCADGDRRADRWFFGARGEETGPRTECGARSSGIECS